MAWTPTLSAVLGGATKLSDLAEVNNNAGFGRNATTGEMITAGNATEGLTVTGGIDTDGTLLKTKVIDIGDWDMDTTTGDGTTFVTVAHGLTLANIRTVTALIRNDGDTNVRKIDSVNNTTGALIGGVGESDATNVRLVRVTGETFDKPEYDSTSYNRGWIIITHIA